MLFKEAKEAQPWPIRNGIVVAVLLVTSLALLSRRSRSDTFLLCSPVQPPQQPQRQQGSSDQPLASTVPCEPALRSPSPRQFILQRQRQQRLAAAGPVGGYLAACAIIKSELWASACAPGQAWPLGVCVAGCAGRAGCLCVGFFKAATDRGAAACAACRPAQGPA